MAEKELRFSPGQCGSPPFPLCLLGTSKVGLASMSLAMGFLSGLAIKILSFSLELSLSKYSLSFHPYSPSCCMISFDTSCLYLSEKRFSSLTDLESKKVQNSTFFPFFCRLSGVCLHFAHLVYAPRAPFTPNSGTRWILARSWGTYGLGSLHLPNTS